MNGLKVVLIVIVVLLVAFLITPFGRGVINTYLFHVQKADDATNYDTLKKVEDTCRAMMASYNKDKLTYEQYKDSTDEDEHDWAQQAKMRANSTASSYNEYIRKNNFVWKGGVPDDIDEELAYIE